MSNPAPFQTEPGGVAPQSPPFAQPLAYHEFVRRGKPGLVTAVGIISIVLGSFGALSSLSSIFQGIMFGIVGPRTARTATVVMPPPPVTVTPAPAPATAATTAPAGESGVALGSPAAPASQPAATPVTTTTTTTTMTVTAGPGAVSPFPFNLDSGTTVLIFLDGGIGLALAVFLFVLGILTLRGSPRARRGHLWWAWLKLPAAVLGGVSAALLTRALFSGMTVMTAAGTGTPAPMPNGDAMAVVQAIFSAGMACIYPVAILIVMRAKSVRAYYDAGAGRPVA